MTTEEWRNAPTLEGYYEVSSLGRVRRIAPGGAARVNHIMRPSIARGYLRFEAAVDKQTRSVSVHALVALAFVGPRPTLKHEVNHLDGDKTNNTPCNLEWTTRGDNLRHAYQLGLRDRLLLSRIRWEARHQ